MLKLLILAQHHVTCEALRAVAALRVAEDEVKKIPKRVIDVSIERSSSTLFRELSGWIDHELAKIHFPSDELVVLVDAVKPDSLNPIAADGWDATLAMLILAFPEVRWIFGSSRVSKDAGEGWQSVLQWHGLKAFLLRENSSQLFDGSGLRQWVLKRAKEYEKGNHAPFIPLREHWAAAIDDEVTYAYFNAYTCYRFGFRSWAVNSDRLFGLLFKKPETEDKEYVPASLTVEDLYLGFVDKRADDHYSSLPTRNDQLKRLNDVEFRHFVTTGHRNGANIGPDGGENAAALRALSAAGRGGRTTLKPSPGIFSLWEESGLADRWVSTEEEGRRRRGYAPGYVWPPRTSTQYGDHRSLSGHSAPGRLLQVSEFLIVRAERLIADGVSNVPQAVRGAVMASTAQELLGDRTPTTARDALELKHRFEVIAECQFGGVEFNIDLNPRFKEIKAEMRTLGEWFSHRRRDASLVNGELILISRLLAIFRHYDELDEAETCRRRVRDLHRTLWAGQQGWKTWAILPLKWYVDKLVGSTQLVFWAILGWLSIILMAKVGLDRWAATELLEHVSQTVLHFVGGEPLTTDKALPPFLALKVGLSVFAALCGFLHLGILIANIYRSISRT